MSFGRTGAWVVVLLVCTAPAHGDELPPWFPTAGLSVNPNRTVYEQFGRGTFTVGPGDGQEVELTGKHWRTDLYPDGDPANWSWNGMQKWALLKPRLEQLGWKVVRLQQDNGAVRATLSRGAAPAASYLSLSLTKDDPYSNSAEIVEQAPPNLSVSLKPPGKVPEADADDADFPFLTPLPGAKLRRTEQFDAPLDVSLSNEADPHLVGSSYRSKIYDGPEALSALLFVQTYSAALEKAGWQVLERREGANLGGGIVIAHDAKNGRDLWLYLSSGGAEWTASVADIGRGLKSALEQACKVAVYGINFDFNKSTLHPDSESVLQQVLAVLRQMPALKAEIGGHTDNVGGAEYNAKLSAARADAVKSWLVKHGIPEGRLSSRGYGDRSPVAENDTPANRAKNRRVELRKVDCERGT